jgi:hypothetical protein
MRVPPLLVKVTTLLKSPAAVGQNCTATSAVWLALRLLKEPPETILNGALVVAVPLNVPPPVFFTVKIRNEEH